MTSPIRHLKVEDVRIVNYVLTAVAVVVTCIRLGDRIRTARFWWDDVWAAFTMLLLIVFMAAVEVHLQDPARHSARIKLIIAYFCPHFFYAVTWSARTSILLTIIRISQGTLRRVLVGVGVLFGVTWAILFSQVWWVCEGNPAWKKESNPQCPLGLDVAIAQVITDVLSDAILVFAPIRLVWRIRLTGAQKIRVIAIFSTTLVSTAISLNHAYFVLKWGGLQEALAAVMQCCVSLIVANLSVIIALIFRISTDADDMTTVPSFGMFSMEGMGSTMRSYMDWERRQAAAGAAIKPGITSTFMTSNGGVRRREAGDEDDDEDADFDSKASRDGSVDTEANIRKHKKDRSLTHTPEEV
ncbi:hypothetical protein CPC08DRAFT_392912 [Agrocybe pediades]|nr:hypothetical protein CPC08DRAFT_392912 [Agrocybe pediades]